MSAQKLKLVQGQAGCIYLIDTMSFIFRAYHAMARQRGMSTKTGLPTAATYVFVNMLRKLRDDFSPEYLAAVFDVAAPTFRDRQAEGLTSVRRFDLQTGNLIAGQLWFSSPSERPKYEGVIARGFDELAALLRQENVL